jgi:hypothetical protein
MILTLKSFLTHHSEVWGEKGGICCPFARRKACCLAKISFPPPELLFQTRVATLQVQVIGMPDTASLNSQPESSINDFS